MNDIDWLLDVQDGVISRRQAHGAGLTISDIKRRIRRREWARIHPGVYVHHTGPPTWRQRAWAAVLACWPAALDGVSALRAHEGPGRQSSPEAGPVHVVVAHGRKVVAPEGVVVRSSRSFDDAVQANLSPPRMRYDDVVLELADRAHGVVAMVAVLADACGGRRTSADRLLRRLADRPRVRHRAQLRNLLTDVREGTCSVLEHRYLTHVERAHGLPRGLRQVAERDRLGRAMFRDVRYGGKRPPWRLIVELDGRMHHSSARARDSDMQRDLEAAVDGDTTSRIGYGQVFDRACVTAVLLEQLMQRLGWPGEMTRCPHCPATVQQDWRSSGSPG